MQKVVAAVLTAFLSVVLPAHADEYRVAFGEARGDDQGLRRAEVMARLTPLHGRISMTRAAADTGLYHGWATFVLDIAAADPAGRPLDLVYEAPGVWRVAGWRRGEVVLSYTLSLAHDRFPNEPGDDELAYARPYGVMWTGRALFVEGAPSTNINVEFEAADGWRVSAPWVAADGDGLHFRPSSTDDLLDSAFFAVEHAETVLASGARIAVAPDMTTEAALYEETLNAAMTAYERLFGAPAGRSPVVIGARGSYWGGGVIGRSISMMHGGPLDENTGPIGRHVVTHEVFHLWNAQWRYDESEQPALEWFSEGTAEYYAALSAARGEARQVLLGLIASHFGSYRSALEGGSIASAGPTKLENQASYDRIYSGGFVAVMALDLMIRQHTRNAHSLDGVMRRIHTEYAGSGTQRLTRRRLARTIEASTGFDAAPFLSAHVEGTDEIPLEELARDVGLCISANEQDGDWSANATWCENLDAPQNAALASWLQSN
ncbi:MAG: hypothetical protein R3C27_10805 [Hyphomonadaceae bacterium]